MAAASWKLRRPGSGALNGSLVASGRKYQGPMSPFGGTHAPVLGGTFGSGFEALASRTRHDRDRAVRVV